MVKSPTSPHEDWLGVAEVVDEVTVALEDVEEAEAEIWAEDWAVVDNEGRPGAVEMLGLVEVLETFVVELSVNGAEVYTVEKELVWTATTEPSVVGLGFWMVEFENGGTAEPPVLVVQGMLVVYAAKWEDDREVFDAAPNVEEVVGSNGADVYTLNPAAADSVDSGSIVCSP
jgi:hypothetical protein